MSKLIGFYNKSGAVTLALEDTEMATFLGQHADTLGTLEIATVKLVTKLSTIEAAEKMKAFAASINPEMSELPSIFEMEEEAKEVSENELKLNALKRFTQQNDYKPVRGVSLVENIKVEESANIGRIGYTNDHGVLITFLDGNSYVYENVPEKEFENFKFAPSLGSALHRELKGKYRYSRID